MELYFYSGSKTLVFLNILFFSLAVMFSGFVAGDLIGLFILNYNEIDSMAFSLITGFSLSMLYLIYCIEDLENLNEEKKNANTRN